MSVNSRLEEMTGDRQVAALGDPTADPLVERLKEDGIVVLPNLLSRQQLAGMKRAFEAKLFRLRWNNLDGYEKTEPFRHMVEDVLLLDQAFMDLALHPTVKEILGRYLGDAFALTEAKGWKSLPTRRDFHGWHADAWYDQNVAKEIHGEVKLAMYLTDVRSGAFNYIKGSHGKQHPRRVPNAEVADMPQSQIVEMIGPAGTAFLFDTSGIHRQGVPILEERQAIFYNYHDPRVPIQDEDIKYYRYRPLLLNAAFLGNLSKEDQRILGFGDKTNFVSAFLRQTKYPVLQSLFQSWFDARVMMSMLSELIGARLKRGIR